MSVHRYPYVCIIVDPKDMQLSDSPFYQHNTTNQLKKRYQKLVFAAVPARIIKIFVWLKIQSAKNYININLIKTAEQIRKRGAQFG